jgi:hypothetical protein
MGNTAVGLVVRHFVLLLLLLWFIPFCTLISSNMSDIELNCFPISP